jgi:hypothetical protein
MANLETALRQPGFDLYATLAELDFAPLEASQLGAVNSPCRDSSAPWALEVVPETASKQGSRRSRTIFIPLHEWEGTVNRLLDDAFIGSMVDLSEREKGFQDEAEFPLSDLPPDAEPLLKEGAIFRWSIGYFIVDGTRHRASKIVFRRMPAWTKWDLETAARYASDVSKSVTWE